VLDRTSRAAAYHAFQALPTYANRLTGYTFSTSEKEFFQMGEMINFRHVNAEGSFTALLNHHGLEFTQKGDQVRLRCPFHDDTNPSLSITLVDTNQAQANTFHCFG